MTKFSVRTIQMLMCIRCFFQLFRIVLLLLLLLQPVLCAGVLGGQPNMAFAYQVNSEDDQGEEPAALYDVSSAMRSWSKSQRQRFDQAIISAYQATVQYGSSDRVLIEQTMREEFLKSVKSHLLAQQAEANGVDQSSEPESDLPEDATLVWRLLSLRKRGALPKLSNTKKVPQETPEISANDQVCAEVASRRSEEKFSATLDRILADENGRQFFASIAIQLGAGESTKILSSEKGASTQQQIQWLDQIRRTALALRKTRRLRPELSARLIDWEIQQLTYTADELSANLETDDLGLVPDQPGIYLFRDQTGYLYIGEAIDLRERMKQHLSESDRKQLADYLQQSDLGKTMVDFHVFPSDSPGRNLSVRRAYESELIRSRKPRFNIRP